MEKAANYNPTDPDSTSAYFSANSFIKQDKPMKEFNFEEGAKAICCTWLPTDTNLFAVGYEN